MHLWEDKTKSLNIVLNERRKPDHEENTNRDNKRN